MSPYSTILCRYSTVSRQPAQIRARSPGTEVLIFTMYDNDRLIEDLLKAGARGYLLKSDANRRLIDAIDALSSHKPFFTEKVSEALLESFRLRRRGRTSPITSRERSVLQLIAEGHTNREVGGILNISLKTVE